MKYLLREYECKKSVLSRERIFSLVNSNILLYECAETYIIAYNMAKHNDNIKHGNRAVLIGIETVTGRIIGITDSHTEKRNSVDKSYLSVSVSIAADMLIYRDIDIR